MAYQQHGIEKKDRAIAAREEEKGLTSMLIYVASLAVLSSQPSGSLPTYELSALETASIDA